MATAKDPPPIEDGLPPASVEEDEVADPGAPVASEGRYRFLQRLGVGGLGEVWRATDSRLGREVALKLVRRDKTEDDRVTRSILHEAQVLAGLSHPAIIPIHDLGHTEDGRFFYAMKEVEGRNLAEILGALHRDDAGAREAFTLPRLLQIFQKVVEAIAFVHSRGVIHRDLKPLNIMVGPYGEVQLIDWGLARRRRQVEVAPLDGNDGQVTRESITEIHSMDQGMVQGTPAYIAPEQVQGKLFEVDERSDVYGLGAVLYEILCYRAPFVMSPQESMVEFLRRVVRTEPEPPSQVAPADADVPPELERLARTCMAKKKEQRLNSAVEVGEALLDFIEGREPEEAKHQAAAHFLTLAQEQVATYRILKERTEAEGESLASHIREIHSASPLEEKRALWEREAWISSQTRKAWAAFSAATGHFEEALAQQPTLTAARAGLAELYWDRFREAQAAGGGREMAWYESLLLRYDDGRFAAKLQGEARLSVETAPRGVEVLLQTFREMDGRLLPSAPRALGRTPLLNIRLDPGRHQLVLRASGYRELRHPLQARSGETLRVDAQLYTQTQVPMDFALIPRGPFPWGGDREAPGSGPLRIVTLPDFAISLHPVSFSEYLTFLQSLAVGNEAVARRRLPRCPFLSRSHWKLQQDGAFVLVTDDGKSTVAGVPTWPVFGISWEDGVAYCRWKSQRDDRPYRLCSDAEWEKAARSPLGIHWPWGDRFDLTYCRMARSGAGGSQPGPGPGPLLDTSLYGVIDMAGGVREWCGDFFNENGGLRVVRGGSWMSEEAETRACSRRGLPEGMAFDDVGFRMAFSL